jgi:hypothetical protein
VKTSYPKHVGFRVTTRKKRRTLHPDFMCVGAPNARSRNRGRKSNQPTERKDRRSEEAIGFWIHVKLRYSTVTAPCLIRKRPSHISHHILAIMGGGSGLLKSLRLRSSSKKKAKGANKDEEILDAAGASSSPPSSSLPKTPRGFPGSGGGGVAITCGSGRSFFRSHNQHLYDDSDSTMINLSRSTAVETVTSSSATSTTSSAQPDPQQQAPTGASSPSKGLLPSPSTPPKDPNGSPSAASVASASSSAFGTPKIRGKEVASKAAIFESKSFQGSNSNSPGPFSDASSVNTSYSSLSPPPSNSRRSATLKHRDFWQTVLKPTSSEDEDYENEPDLVSASSGSNTADVKKKSQWLQSAFSPKGGGNMPGLEHEDESMTQDLTETVGGDDGSVSVLSESVHTNTAATPVPSSSPSYYNYWTASNTPPRRRSPDAAPTLTLQDQVWTNAYQVWYQRGLLPWKPDFDECFPLQDVAEEGPNHQPPRVASASPRDLEEEDHDHDQFHDSFMDDDDHENSASRGVWMGGDTAPASPGSVQASRTLHRNMTQSCPLLTVFGGNGNGNAAPAPTAVDAAAKAPVTPEAPVTPKTMMAPEAPATSPSAKSSSSGSSSPIKLLPSLTPSPSQVYSNYVNAYTAYVQDRHNPTKATAHNEARTLLEKSRTRQPL